MRGPLGGTVIEAENAMASSQSKKLTRRDFLKLMGAAGGGLVLSACAPVSAPMPTPAPSATPLPTTTATPTSTPTATPTATPTPIPTIQVGNLSVPDPRITNPKLFDLRNPDAPIPQFVNAMKMAGIEITAEQVAQGITYEALKDKDGNPFVVAVYNLDPPLFPEQYRGCVSIWGHWVQRGCW
jgi:hypothetical protein